MSFPPDDKSLILEAGILVNKYSIFPDDGIRWFTSDRDFDDRTLRLFHKSSGSSLLVKYNRNNFDLS